MPFKDPEKKRQWRIDHPESIRAHKRQAKAVLRAAIDAIKSEPCTDCGRCFPPECMDFDHLDGSSKLSNVSKFVQAGYGRRTLSEIAKCELVCACCHRVRTKRRTAR